MYRYESLEPTRTYNVNGKGVGEILVAGENTMRSTHDALIHGAELC